MQFLKGVLLRSVEVVILVEKATGGELFAPRFLSIKGLPKSGLSNQSAFEDTKAKKRNKTQKVSSTNYYTTRRDIIKKKHIYQLHFSSFIF
jgi:hypothetical protein